MTSDQYLMDSVISLLTQLSDSQVIFMYPVPCTTSSYFILYEHYILAKTLSID